MITNSAVKFYADTILIEMVLGNKMSKTAGEGVVSDLAGFISNYVGGHIDPNNKSSSILNILAPGAVFLAFRAMNLSWLGILLGLAMEVFHIDVSGILKSIYDKIKSGVSEDKKVNSTQVDEMVNSSIAEHVEPATDAEAQAYLESKSFNQRMREARLLKLSMIEYNWCVLGQARPRGNPRFIDAFKNNKLRTVSLLRLVLGWFFKLALASAGLMVAGDVINKMLGRPNALDKSLQQGKPAEDQKTLEPIITPTQTKFKINPSYQDIKYNINSSWIVNAPNDPNSIENIIIEFAKEVYSGLDGKEGLIRNASGFKVIRDRIVWYNHASQGDNMVYIPKYLRTKKEIADLFIDDVAKNST